MNWLKKMWDEPTTLSPDTIFLSAMILFGFMTLNYTINPLQTSSFVVPGLLACALLLIGREIDKRRVKEIKV